MMQFFLLISAATSFVAAQDPVAIETGQLGDAIQNFDNPDGAAYRAVVGTNTHNVSGMITAITGDDGATEFAVEFSNLPSEGGPFSYHIHVDPVAADGHCNSTLAHLDPYLRGEATPCVSESPQTCQVGDLGGKHGKATEATFNASYTDTFVSLKEGVGSFFGNRSFVVHFANKTRIGCGNFTSLSATTRPNLLNSSSTSTTLAPNFATTAAPNATANGGFAAPSSSSLAFANATTAFAPLSSASNPPQQIADNAAMSLHPLTGWFLLAFLGWVLCLS